MWEGLRTYVFLEFFQGVFVELFQVGVGKRDAAGVPLFHLLEVFLTVFSLEKQVTLCIHFVFEFFGAFLSVADLCQRLYSQVGDVVLWQ